jgi:RNA polymerase sigma-70 factor (ECF subfamily)
MASRRESVVRQIPRLRRYARALTGDDGEADDLIQDTLERALLRLDQWRDGDTPCKWMFSILHNLHVDGRRRRSRRPLHVGLEDVAASSPAAAADASGCDVDRALQLLNVGQREVLLLVGVEGLTYAETADVLDIPIGTVMSRLARGRHRLRLLMACETQLKEPMKRVSLRGGKLAAGPGGPSATAWRTPPQRQ